MSRRRKSYRRPKPDAKYNETIRITTEHFSDFDEEIATIITIESFAFGFSQGCLTLDGIYQLAGLRDAIDGFLAKFKRLPAGPVTYIAPDVAAEPDESYGPE